MVAEEEKKERERQEKEEAERLKQLQKTQEETSASIDRVREHYLKTVQQPPTSKAVKVEPIEVDEDFEQTNRTEDFIMANQPSNSKKKSFRKKNSPRQKRPQTLGQLHGKKRKRQLSPEITRPFNRNPRKNDFADDKPSKKRR